jgi:hypothetical protein
MLERPVVLTRNPDRARASIGHLAGSIIAWNPLQGPPPVGALEGIDTVFHLAGESVAEGRWTTAQKQRIRDSRVIGTRHLVQGLRLAQRPLVLVSASAVGWYGGQRGDEVLTEASAAPEPADFLAVVCAAWEAATAPAEAAGVRTVHLRTGIVLTPSGGALGRMITPFKLGLGGRIASGKQWMSWISIDDEVGAIRHALTTDALAGPVNATAPEPVTNADFTKTLGSVLHRPTLLPTPLAPLRVVYGGELVRALLVDGQRVLPTALESSGYEFAHRDLATALRAVTGA